MASSRGFIDLDFAATLLLAKAPGGGGGGGGGISAQLGYPGVLVFESASPFPDSSRLHTK